MTKEQIRGPIEQTLELLRKACSRIMVTDEKPAPKKPAAEYTFKYWLKKSKPSNPYDIRVAWPIEEDREFLAKHLKRYRKAHPKLSRRSSKSLPSYFTKSLPSYFKFGDNEFNDKETYAVIFRTDYGACSYAASISTPAGTTHFGSATRNPTPYHLSVFGRIDGKEFDWEEKYLSLYEREDAAVKARHDLKGIVKKFAWHHIDFAPRRGSFLR